MFECSANQTYQTLFYMANQTIQTYAAERVARPYHPPHRYVTRW